jgi:hypothetical protein
MQLLIMQFSPPSCYFLALSANILLSTLFSNTLSFMFLSEDEGEVPQPYKKTDKVMYVFYILF